MVCEYQLKVSLYHSSSRYLRWTLADSARFRLYLPGWCHRQLCGECRQARLSLFRRTVVLLSPLAGLAYRELDTSKRAKGSVAFSISANVHSQWLYSRQAKYRGSAFWPLVIARMIARIRKKATEVDARRQLDKKVVAALGLDPRTAGFHQLVI